jgi:hypothetical protein
LNIRELTAIISLKIYDALYQFYPRHDQFRPAAVPLDATECTQRPVYHHTSVYISQGIGAALGIFFISIWSRVGFLGD